MYLSDRDINAAIAARTLIVKPRTPAGPTSVDLHLDKVGTAKIWDIKALAEHNALHGLESRELHIAKTNYPQIAAQYLVPPPKQKSSLATDLVVRRDDRIIIRPFGFVLWQTKETIGTPEESPKYICFIDGKSTRARSGLLVHLTAPTIHAGWSGKVTLEMSNLGPFDIVLQENDVVAQIVIAEISSPPLNSMADIQSKTHEQKAVSGRQQKSRSKRIRKTSR
jgi:dCTP deaminase